MLFMSMMNTADSFPGKGLCKHTEKRVHKQKWLVLCNFHELFVAFKESNTDLKIGSSSFVLSDLNGVLFQVHKENTWYVSALLIKTPFC